MADPIRQLLSQTSYDADGVTTVWNFSFAGGYIDRSHVKVQTLDPVTGFITQVPITNGNFIGDFQLSLSPAVATGLELTIYRDTPKDLPIVNFADKAALTELSLDLNAKQAIFVAAESNDGLATAIDSVAEIANFVDAAQGFAEDAEDSAVAAAASAVSAATNAGVAATQAGIATTKAGEAAASAASIAGGPVANWISLTGIISRAQALVALALTKSEVGLANVDNTSDTNKPVSTAQAAATAAAVLIAAPTGLVDYFLLSVAPAGWVPADGTTIGSAASGATRANADTQALFNALWAMPVAIAPVLTSAGGASTRGANAAADWAANKRMTVPDLRDDFIRGASATNVLGVKFSDQNKAHTHAALITASPGGSSARFSGYIANDGLGGVPTDSSGGAEARPRGISLLTCIKL